MWVHTPVTRNRYTSYCTVLSWVQQPSSIGFPSRLPMWDLFFAIKRKKNPYIPLKLVVTPSVTKHKAHGMRIRSGGCSDGTVRVLMGGCVAGYSLWCIVIPHYSPEASMNRSSSTLKERKLRKKDTQRSHRPLAGREEGAWQQQIVAPRSLCPGWRGRWSPWRGQALCHRGLRC